MEYFTIGLPKRKKSKKSTNNKSGVVTGSPFKKSKQITNFTDFGEMGGFAHGVSGNGDVGGGGAPVAMAMGESTEDDGNVYEYSCAMLPISKENSAIMQYWAKQNIPVESLLIDPDQGMDGYEDNPHVTVKYGLHTDDVTDIEKLTSGYGPVPVKFGKVSKFENPDFDVIKIEIISEPLHELNKLISDNLENTDTYPTYEPHATLAFVKKGTCDKIVGDDFFTDMKDSISEIYFTARDGSEHYIDI
jgi:hypothetical protein